MSSQRELLHSLLGDFVSKSPQMVDIGLRIVDVNQGVARMQLPDRHDWLGDPQRGLLHPGPVIVLADSCCGLAVGSALPARVVIATLDLRMDYLRAASPGQDVHCEMHCHRVTRNVAFVRGEVWQGDRAEPVADVHAAFMLSTPAKRAPERMGEGAAAEALAWQPPGGGQRVLAGVDIPYVDYLDVRLAQGGATPVYHLPFQHKFIGNPQLPALHGGVVAGFAQTAATLQLIEAMGGAKLPKCVDFSIDYLRSGRPESTYASCEIVRLGGRVALVHVRCWQSKGPAYPITVARGQFLLTDPQEGQA